MSLPVRVRVCNMFCATPARFYYRLQQGHRVRTVIDMLTWRVHFAPARRLAGADCINLEANTPKNNHNNTRRQRQQQAAATAVGCAVLWHATCFYINQLLAKHDASAHAIDLYGVQRGSYCPAPFKAHFKLLGKLH